MFLTVFHSFSLIMPKNESLLSLFTRSLCLNSDIVIRSFCSLQKCDHERIASIALYKRATMSDLLRLLMTKERQEQFSLFHELIALSLTKKSDSLEKPRSDFPTLLFSVTTEYSILTVKWSFADH